MVAKKKKAPVYEALEDELSTETAFLQAATALDIAALWAVESRDTQTLGQVAQAYIELGTRMMGPQSDEDEIEEHDLTGDSDFGFVPEDVAAAREVANGRTNRTTKARAPRWRISRVHKEHGEL